MVLIKGLPPGSATGRAMGGGTAWSDTVATLNRWGWLLQCQIAMVGGASRSDLPRPPEPPEPGWQDKARTTEQRRRRKAERWLARHPELRQHVT